MQRARDQRGFFRRNREGRREKDVIAALAVDAALHRVRKDTFFQTGLANLFRNAFGLRKRFASGFVFDEFDAEEEAEATDITDMRVRLKRG